MVPVGEWQHNDSGLFVSPLSGAAYSKLGGLLVGWFRRRVLNRRRQKLGWLQFVN